MSKTVSDGRHSFTPQGVMTIGRLIRMGCFSVTSVLRLRNKPMLESELLGRQWVGCGEDNIADFHRNAEP
jgi:hypothetical protein